MASVLLTVIAVLFCGCAWSPGRDNPRDPASPYYEPPPVLNRAPTIDTLFIITDCAKDLIASVCAFEARCRVSDRDENFLYDSVMAQLDTIAPWKMSYDAGEDYFVVRRSQRDLPTGSLDPFQFRPFTVTVRDDSGATISRTSLFPEKQVAYPEPDYPLGDIYDQDTIHTVEAVVSWTPWVNFTRPHTYGVTLYLRENILVWDSTSIMPVDTPLVIPVILQTSEVVRNPYKWYLTVTDELGNRMTAEPQYFVTTILEPPPICESSIIAYEIE